MADERVSQRQFGIMQARLTEVIRDMAEHKRLHEREEASRAVNRRWAIGLAVAMLAAVGSLYPYLYAIHR